MKPARPVLNLNQLVAGSTLLINRNITGVQATPAIFLRSHSSLPSPTCRFNISAPYHHDITLASGALQNVVSNGTGTDLVIDLHR